MAQSNVLQGCSRVPGAASLPEGEMKNVADFEPGGPPVGATTAAPIGISFAPWHCVTMKSAAPTTIADDRHHTGLASTEVVVLPEKEGNRRMKRLATRQVAGTGNASSKR